MEHARPPAELSLDGGPAARSESWRKWRKLFEVFTKASGVIKEPKEVQASLLVNLIGSAGYEVYTTFTYEEGESEDDIKCLLKKFDSYFGAKPNITVRRFKFFTRNQEEGENIDQYVTALRLLSQQCEFGELQDSLLRDRIVCGIINNTVRDRLLRTDGMDLAKAIQICQAAEITKEESLCIDGSSGSGSGSIQVNAVQDGGASGRARGWRGMSVQRGGGGRRRRGAGGGARSSARPRLPCATCGAGRCPGEERCPARNALCYVCENKGHFSRVCQHKKVIRKVLNLSVDTVESDYEDSEEELFYVNTIGQDKKWHKSSKEWVESVKCNGEIFMLKIDTGSMLNVISKSEYSNLGLSINNLKPFTKRVHSFTGNPLPIIGTNDIPFTYNNKCYVLPFVVADLNCQNVLGLEGCISLGLLSRVNAINIEKYSHLFKGLGKLPTKYSIVVDKNVQPVICPTRKIPLGLKGKLLEELRRMEGLGVVRKVTHPTDWVNAIVLVPKKDGSIRVCLDPRPLNRAVRRAHYSLPTVPELAARLRGAAVFSVLDARCGFWMVEIDDASADLCTFSTPFGRYQFLRLPYGINCAPEVFHAKLRQHLEDLEGVESFIDDVIVWGRTKEEHDWRLECLLQRSQAIGIKFNREKCKFGVKEIKYLGHKFDANGMLPDDSKVKAIMEMPYPTDRKGLERFLGMVNYLSKFIQNYSDCVNVLRSLLKKDSEWVWEAHHSTAVDELKRKLASAPVLALYSERAPVLLSVDASARALGAVLLQAGRPVEFASLTLTDTQTRYAQIEKEMLAIVFAVERFRQYILGRADVTVQTDHKPLEALFNKPLVSVPARLQRMMLRVQGYDIKVVYTPGKYMYIADTLSRAPLSELMHERVTEEVEAQVSDDIGYVVYSALGSFYIPSCIMVFVYIRIYYAAKARARRGIRKKPRPNEQQTSFSNPRGTRPMPATPSIPMPPGNDSINSVRDNPISTIEAQQVAIPTVTCDLASDISTSEAGDTMPPPIEERKDTLRIVTSAQVQRNLLASCPLRNSTLSVNGELEARGRAPSVAIDTDMVSELEPSSSDSGVVSRHCAVVKPLKLRIFKKTESNRRPEKVQPSKSELEPALPKPIKPRDPEREKRRLARKKEKRATLILGLIMGSFIACWLPFFFLYILKAACPRCVIPDSAFAIAFWLGYMNSVLNPVIYTIFNKDFRRAFRRILFK